LAVSEDEDSYLVLSDRYKDWHRVERAKQTFANKAKSLQEHGWADLTVMVERSSVPSSAGLRLPREHAQKL